METTIRLPDTAQHVDGRLRAPARRRFIRAAVAGTVLLGAGAGPGSAWLHTGLGTQPLDVDAVLDRLDVMEKSGVTSRGTWTPGQIFTHLAQSIEYAMSAYPLMKPQLFRDTVGAAALEVFGRKRRMMHDLSEPIEGAPAIDAAEDFRVGLMRLRHAFINFRRYGGPLAPHFAFGVLDKQQYEAVHLMHFWNHMEEIEVVA